MNPPLREQPVHALRPRAMAVRLQVRSTSILIGLLAAIMLPPASVAGVGAVRGTVTDSANGEALIFANVTIRGTTLGVTTNLRGFYFLPGIPAGRHTLQVSFIGYRQRTFVVNVSEGATLTQDVRLVPDRIEMDEMTVTRETERPTDTDISLTRLSARDIGMVPAGLEGDIFRVLQAEPGVGSTGDVSARYYVRGGGGDQNLLLLDGATIYNPFHALGVFSVIDPDIIAGMEFHKGGFSPEHAGRLSSILNVVTRDGNRSRFGGSAQAGLLSGKVTLEGPVPDGSFLIAARKSYSARALQRYLPGKSNPFAFYDASAKVTYGGPAAGENGRLVAHAFLSDDRVRNGDPLQEDYYVRNNVAGVSWHRIWSAPLVSTVSVTYSGYDGEVLVNDSRAPMRSNRVRDVQFSADLTYMYTNRDELAFGVQSKRLSTALDLENVFGVLTRHDTRGTDLHAYASYRLRASEIFGLTIGARIRFATLTASRPTFIEPRASFTLVPSPVLALKAAVGWYAQEVVTLTDESEVLSVFDPWVIVPPSLGPPQAWHFNAGVSYHPHADVLVDVEAYYKPMNDLVDADPGRIAADAREFINVSGRSYGLEWLVRYDGGAFRAQASYALGYAERILGGVRVVPKYDVRHSVHLLTAWSPGGGVRLTAGWTLKSGAPFTPITGFHDRPVIDPVDPWSITGPAEPVTMWGGRNSRRLPWYHRLDAGGSLGFDIGPVAMTVELNLLNVYDRRNIFYYDRDTGEETTMLRFFPSLSVKGVY